MESAMVDRDKADPCLLVDAIVDSVYNEYSFPLRVELCIVPDIPPDCGK